MDEVVSFRESQTKHMREQSCKTQGDARPHQSRASGMTEPLTNVDTTWLRMNEPTNLMVISGLMMFEDRLDPQRVADHIGQRLHPYPRFHQRVIRGPGGRPVWEEDPSFDIRSHVQHVALPAPHDRAALQAMVSDLMSTPLDENLPLWQAHVIDGFEGGSVVFFRLHHAIADGFALLKVMLSLTDDPPGESPAAAVHSVFPCAMSSDLRVGRRGSNGLRDPARLRAMAKLGLGATASLARLALLPFDPDTALKGPLGVKKLAAWCDPIPLELLRAAGRASGATVNDVLLTAISGGIRAYLLESGHQVDGLEMRAVMPVNLRDSSDPDTLGNGFGLTFVPLPVGIDDPAERLRRVHQHTTRIKGSPEALAAFGVLGALGSLTPRLAELVVRMFGAKATSVITNVPGPRTIRYLAGKPIKRILFWVPQSGRLGMGMSIFSYAGEVVLGAATDARLVPDPDRLVRACAREAELLSR